MLTIISSVMGLLVPVSLPVLYINMAATLIAAICFYALCNTRKESKESAAKIAALGGASLFINIILVLVLVKLPYGQQIKIVFPMSFFFIIVWAYYTCLHFFDPRFIEQHFSNVVVIALLFFSLVSTIGIGKRFCEVRRIERVKPEIFQERIDKLQNLDGRLSKREKELSTSVKEFKQGVFELKDHIRATCKKASRCLSRFESAMKDTVVGNDLRLIQKKRSNIAKLDSMIKQIQKSREEIRFLSLSADTDADLLKVIEGGNASELINEIDSVIAGDNDFPSLPDGKTKDARKLGGDLQDIWDEIKKETRELEKKHQNEATQETATGTEPYGIIMVR